MAEFKRGINMNTCAYEYICKGVCKTPYSCLKHKKTEQEYWEEIKTAIVISERFKRIQHYITTVKKPNMDIVKHWMKL